MKLASNGGPQAVSRPIGAFTRFCRGQAAGDVVLSVSQVSSAALAPVISVATRYRNSRLLGVNDLALNTRYGQLSDVGSIRSYGGNRIIARG